MTTRMLRALIMMLILLPAAATRAEWPPMFWEETSIATTAAPADSRPVLYNCPDGSVNLSDIPPLMSAMGADCP